MSYLREKWPTSSITPKLHMLEDHVVTFIKKWKVGLGLYNEQGGESIHAEFNNIHRMFCRMKPNSRRLLSMLKEHYVRVHPIAKKLKPKIQKRKKIDIEE